jgi:hypothetical protein
VEGASFPAHGGLQGWFERGALKFRFSYRPKGGRPARDTRQVIDTWSSRARHELSDDASQRFGWDGQRAWLQGMEEDKHKARFWALTPFYFIAIPFVLADKGVNLAKLEPTELEGRAYELVKVTYGDGVGDSPKDFYIIYIDKESHRVGGVRYIVSYPGFFPDGGHSPEKLMTYDGQQRVDGILFPKTFRSFKWEEGKQGELVTETTLSEVSFEPDLDPKTFEVPADAKVLEGY